jgi:hypothetical protein
MAVTADSSCALPLLLGRRVPDEHRHSKSVENHRMRWPRSWGPGACECTPYRLAFGDPP